MRGGQGSDPDGAGGMSDMAWADAPPCADGLPRDALSSTHRQELEEASAIDPAVIAERRYRTLLPEHRDELAMQGIVLRSTDSFLYRHGFLGQPGECIHAAVVSANARRTTAGARKPSRSINHCWL